MKPTTRLVLAAATLATLIGAGAWWWLHRERPSLDLTPPALDRAREMVASAPADATGVDAARAAEPQAPPEPASREAPESYKKALGALTGRLLEPDLTPVADLPISAVEFEPSRFLLDTAVLLDEQHAPPPLETGRTKSGTDGRFTLAGLEPRAVHLLGIDLGGPRSNFRIVDQSPRPGEVLDLGDIVLEPFVTFTGRVVDSERKPVAGARVRATNLPALIFQFGIEDIRRGCGVMVEVLDAPKAFEIPPVVWEYEKLVPIPTTYSGADGTFRLPGVPLGMVTVVADHPGKKAVTKTQASGKGRERAIGDLYLGDGFVVRGQVVDGAENPVAGIDVLVGIRNPAVPVPAALLQPAGRTDGKGFFELAGLPQGSDAYVATRASRGQPLQVHGPFKAIDDVLLVRLRPPSGLIARLVDEAGAPLEEAELFIAPDPIEGGAPLPPILAPPMQKLVDVAPLGDGLFRIAGLDFGKYRLIGRADDFALATTKVEVANPPQTFDLVFARANSLALTVQSVQEGEPLEWAFASLCPEGVFERPVARGRTNRDGRVVLERIPAGKYTLTVQHPLKATLEQKVEVPCEPLVVALPLGGNLKGRVHTAGADPGKSLFVIVTRREVRRPDAAMPTLSATAETGHFAVVNLEVGNYRYEIRDRIVGKGALALFETFRDDPLAKGDFEIREAETTELDIDLRGAFDGPAGELWGSVTINGVPTAELSVRVEGKRNVTAKTDESGHYRFEALPAGKASLSVQGLKGDSDLLSLASVLHREEIEIVAGDTQQRDFALAIAAVRGRVSGPGLMPAGLGTTVVLRGGDGGMGQFAAVNPLTGSFEMPFVPAGKYDLLVRKRGAAPYSAPIDVDPRRGDVDLDVELIASVAASGTFLLPPGDAPPELEGGEGPRRRFALLTLIDADGKSAGRGEIDWTAMSFRFDDCAPGDYSVQLWRGESVVVARALSIPAGGTSGVELLFEKPKEDEKLVSPFGGNGAPFGRPRRRD